MSPGLLVEPLTEEERNDIGFAISQDKRKLVEKVFGWAKLDCAPRCAKLRCLKRVDWWCDWSPPPTA